MSRLSIITPSQAQTTVEMLYKDLERRIIASPPGLCPVDMAASFLKLCHAQTCGKCTPCREGNTRLLQLIRKIRRGDGTMEDLDTLQDLCQTMKDCSLCGLGQASPTPVISTLKNFRNVYLNKIERGGKE